MSRYLLIEFDDKNSALKLKKQIDQATKSGRSFRVVGYFVKPDGPYCQCPVTEWTFERGRKYAPSKPVRKYGWRKCQVCNLYRDEPGYLPNVLKWDKVIKPRILSMNAKHKNLMSHIMSITSASHTTKRKDG